MTSLVVLATKHAVVMGADSLATVTRQMVSLNDWFAYFDPDNGFRLKLDQGGNPLIKDFAQMYDDSQSVPYNQLLHINKLFKVGNLPMGVMFTGITSIGQETVRGLIAEFSSSDAAAKQTNRRINYTVHSVAERLLQFLRERYKATFTEEFLIEELELLLAGYDRNDAVPSVARINVRTNNIDRVFDTDRFGIAFGGQMDWIQRIVFGTDSDNKAKLHQRVESLMSIYRQKIAEHLESAGHKGIEIPEANTFGSVLNLYNDGWDLDGLDANWGEFSEQNAIDSVDFFLRIMIEAQNVSSQLPTVGGDVHIAVIRQDGYHPVSKEIWKHGDHEVPIPEVMR